MSQKNNNKIKITIFHCTLIYTGGGERIVFGQIDGLKKLGYEVNCFAPVIDRTRCYPDIIDKYPVQAILPQLPRWFPFRHAILLIVTSALIPFLAFRFRDTDLFIGENQPGTWLAYVTAKVLRKPYFVYTCHPNKMVYPRKLSRDQLWKSEPDFYWMSLLFEPLKPLIRILDRRAFTKSGLPVLMNGFFIGREFEKIYKVPWLGCPSGAPYLEKSELKKVLDKAGEGELIVGDLKLKKPYLLFVGRHEVWKRIDLAFKAMVKISKQVPNATLVIPGRHTPHTQTLQKLAKKLGIEKNILFIGEVDQKQLAELYKNGYLFFFPSTREDFGIVMLESMGYGVPVVAWNSAGPTDMINDGENGFLAKPFDVDDLAKKAIFLLKDKELRKKMGEASWQTVKNNYSWKKHIKVFEEHIQKAIN